MLRHNNTDLRNILTEKQGNVTGVIYWDDSIAAPLCVGHIALATFLCHSWYPDHDDDRTILRADHYRDVYAAAIVEAGNSDAKYISKAAMYTKSPLDAVYK